MDDMPHDDNDEDDGGGLMVSICLSLREQLNKKDSLSLNHRMQLQSRERTENTKAKQTISMSSKHRIVSTVDLNFPLR